MLPQSLKECFNNQQNYCEKTYQLDFKSCIICLIMFWCCVVGVIMEQRNSVLLGIHASQEAKVGTHKPRGHMRGRG